MQAIKDFYYKHIYAVIGTLTFHFVLVLFMLLQGVPEKHVYAEAAIEIDLQMLEELLKESPKQEEVQAKSEQQSARPSAKTNQGSKVGAEQNNSYRSQAKDAYFDEEFAKEVAEAQALAADVSNQLNKETKAQEEYAMPEETTEGMQPEEISNTVYSGESNIHYELDKRYHRRLPIPVYLAKGGGRVEVNIWVNNAGKVVKAEIKSVSNLQDPLLSDYALQAAQRSLFNKDASASNPQQGIITYLFVAQ